MHDVYQQVHGPQPTQWRILHWKNWMMKSLRFPLISEPNRVTCKEPIAVQRAPYLFHTRQSHFLWVFGHFHGGAVPNHGLLVHTTQRGIPIRCHQPSAHAKSVNGSRLAHEATNHHFIKLIRNMNFYIM